jgi:hypothetical protein
MAPDLYLIKQAEQEHARGRTLTLKAARRRDRYDWALAGTDAAVAAAERIAPTLPSPSRGRILKRGVF